MGFSSLSLFPNFRDIGFSSRTDTFEIVSAHLYDLPQEALGEPNSCAPRRGGRGGV